MYRTIAKYGQPEPAKRDAAHFCPIGCERRASRFSFDSLVSHIQLLIAVVPHHIYLACKLVSPLSIISLALCLLPRAQLYHLPELETD